jgi:uncharacterized membrane protein YhiD involved in acid resistance
MFELAGGTALIILCVLCVLSRVEQRIPTRWYKSLRVTVQTDGQDHVRLFRKLLEDRDVRVVDVDYTRDQDEEVEEVTLHVSSTVADPTEAAKAIGEVSGVHRASME